MTPLTPRQLAVFQRTVERRTCGQVRIPAGNMDVHEAITLWQDLVAAFGHSEGRALSPRELELLRKRAWRRSAGHISLTQASLSLDAGMALWGLAGRFEALTARQPRPGLSRAASVAALGLAATQLAACTSLWGGNIKGNFSCSAPGGTCAPSTVIDDQALAVIQNARPMAPAGPYFQPPARSGSWSARLAPSGSGRIAAAGAGMVHRERRVLKVVFPAYVDGAGNFHEPRVVHTVADAGGWMQLSAGSPSAGEQAAGQAEAARAAPPPLAGSTASTPGEAPPAAGNEPGLDAKTLIQKAAPSGPAPDPRVVAEARAKGPARSVSSPVDAIRAEVEAQLGQMPKTTGTASTAPSPAPIKPADAAQPAAQAPAAPAPIVANPPTSFSSKIEE